MLWFSILLIGTQSSLWAKAYDAFGEDSAYAIVYDQRDNSYVIAGYTTNGPLGGIDVLVTKLDANTGNVIWARVYGYPEGEYNDYARCIIRDSTENEIYYVIAGYTKPAPLGGNSDALVIKIKSDGSLVWGYVYDASHRADEYAYSVVKDGNGYLVAGNMNPGPCGVSDFLVFKLRPDGAPVWTHVYGKPLQGRSLNDHAYSIIEDSSLVDATGNPQYFVVVGESKEPEGQTVYGSIFKGRKNDGALVAGDGTLPGWIYDYYIPPYSNHRFCIYSIKNVGGNGYVTTGDRDNDIFVMRLDAGLNILWNKIYTHGGPNDIARARCVEVDKKKYILTGSITPGIPSSASDLLVMKLDSTGSILWSKALTGCSQLNWMTEEDYGECITIGPPGCYAAVGYTKWPSAWRSSNFLLAKMNTAGYIPCPNGDSCLKNVLSKEEREATREWVSCEEALELQQKSIVYEGTEIRDTVICEAREGVGELKRSIIYALTNNPNPFVSTTTIFYTLSMETNVQLGIYNIQGQLVRMLVDQKQKPGLHTAIWNARDDKDNRLAPGVYFCKVKAGGYTRIHKMLLMR